MMTRDRSPGFDIGHPAPGSARVRWPMLLVASLAGFVVWSLQLAANSSIAGLACLENTTRAADDELGWAGWGIEAINVVALVVGLAAILLSLWLIRRTREVDPRPEGGVMSAGEGRARFMAVWGLFSSVLFSAAIAFNTISVFWSGLCPA